MNTKFGYSLSKWEEAKEEMRNILIEIVKKNQKPIPYSELVKKVQTIKLEANSPVLNKMLEEISTEEDAAERGMLTAVVVLKGNGIPGSGFFKLAKSLGRTVSDETEFWISEINKVQRIWKKD